MSSRFSGFGLPSYNLCCSIGYYLGFAGISFWVNLVIVSPLSTMLLSLLLLAIITAGGLALTYLVTEDEPMMWRLAVGCVVGSAVCGTAAFVLGLMFGLSVATAGVSVVVAALPLVLFRDPVHRKRLRTDWRRALGKLEGGSPNRFTTKFTM